LVLYFLADPLVGTLEIRQSQAEQWGVKAYSRLSSGLEQAS